MDKLPNGQLADVYDKARDITNTAYVFDRLILGGSEIYEKKVEDSCKNNEQVAALLNALENDPKVYKWPKNSMGRFIEKTGDNKQCLYYDLDDDMEKRGSQLLPHLRVLSNEVNDATLNALAHEYALSTGVAGSEDERTCAEMLAGRGKYAISSPYRHGAFANQVKKLCQNVADDRNFEIKGAGEELDFESIFKEGAYAY